MSGSPPRLLAITDLSGLTVEGLLERVARLVEAAAPRTVAVLLRDHQASARTRLELGRNLRRLTQAAEQELWVADRADLALLLGADGLHLGEGSVPAAAARRLLGSSRRLSRAWHRATLSERDRVELEGVDAVLLSPVFVPRKGRPALGASALGNLSEKLRRFALPADVYALGGVTATDIAACDAAGARGVAAIGSALGPDADPRALVRALGIARASH